MVRSIWGNKKSHIFLGGSSLEFAPRHLLLFTYLCLLSILLFFYLKKKKNSAPVQIDLSYPPKVLLTLQHLLFYLFFLQKKNKKN